MEKKGLARSKGITGILAVIMFLTGFLFVDRGGFTGNAVLNGQPSFNPIALIGLLLVLCSAVLAVYAVKSK